MIQQKQCFGLKKIGAGAVELLKQEEGVDLHECSCSKELKRKGDDG